jgi:ribosome-binding protein aMBF1 (putative translation factor)
MLPPVGFAVRVIRQARGWSQQELGRRVGIGRPRISHFETLPTYRMKPETR